MTTTPGGIPENEESLVIEGIFLMADKPSASGRIYPRSVLERALNNFKKRHEESEVVGCTLKREDEPSVNHDLGRSSHVVEDIDLNEEGEMLGRIRILPETLAGHQLSEVISQNMKIRLVPRVLGTVENNVVTKAELISIDVTVDD